MSVREGAAGARLEVSLKSHRARFIPELDDDIQFPWTKARGVMTVSLIVSLQSCIDIGGQTRVVLGRVGCILQDVNETKSFSHEQSGSKRIADEEPAVSGQNRSGMTRRDAKAAMSEAELNSKN